MGSYIDHLSCYSDSETSCSVCPVNPMGITVQRSLSPGAMFWDDIESPGPSYAVKPQSAWNRAWAKGVFICVDRSIWSKSTTYSEIFSGIRICTSCKNHPVQKYYENPLKGLAHAKIIKKSVILFRVLNMTIWCKHVHRLELQIFIIFVLRIHQLG